MLGGVCICMHLQHLHAFATPPYIRFLLYYYLILFFIITWETVFKPQQIQEYGLTPHLLIMKNKPLILGRKSIHTKY